MSRCDDFIDTVVNNPEWEVIRKELCKEYSEPTKFNLGGGCTVWLGGEDDFSEEESKNSDLFSEICWWVNNGPEYCQSAPTNIKVYLKRLNVI